LVSPFGESFSNRFHSEQDDDELPPIREVPNLENLQVLQTIKYGALTNPSKPLSFENTLDSPPQEQENTEFPLWANQFS